MKKAAIFIITVFMISSCSLFKKPSMSQEEIDALVNQKAAVEEELANLQQDYDLLKIKSDECAQMLEQQAVKKEEEIKGKYFVIAGSFKNGTYADDYAKKVLNAGGLGKIIAGPSDFQLVVFSAHSTLREASEKMYDVRASLSDDAWIYMDR